MKKRRSRDRTLDAYKKRRKPGAMNLWVAKPREKILTAKVSQISGLVLRAGHTSLGPDGFTSLLQYRKAFQKPMKQLPTFYEKKKAVLDSMKSEIERAQKEMNNWLEGIGRPDLKMSFDEAIHLILD